jgi:transposase InsO family protein
LNAVTDLAETVGMQRACEALQVPRSTLYRWRRPQPPRQPEQTPAPRALSVAEKSTVLETVNTPRFQDQAPREIYAALLDDGIYLCHWRTMYRILAENQQVRERRDQVRHPVYTKPELLATAPCQVWSWDITRLPGPTKWTYFYLYVMLDIFSRLVVGWLVATAESQELAECLITETYAKHQIAKGQLIIHADNGGPMTAKTINQLFIDLDIAESHSRPHVSDDNPYSEAQFKTLKYRPDFPVCFETLEAAIAWARAFFTWYNHEHHHSALGLMTPAAVHSGAAAQLWTARQQVLQTAFQAHPERFVKGLPVPPALPKAVWINPPKEPAREDGVPPVAPAQPGVDTDDLH